MRCSISRFFTCLCFHCRTPTLGARTTTSSRPALDNGDTRQRAALARSLFLSGSEPAGRLQMPGPASSTRQGTRACVTAAQRERERERERGREEDEGGFSFLPLLSGHVAIDASTVLLLLLAGAGRLYLIGRTAGRGHQCSLPRSAPPLQNCKFACIRPFLSFLPCRRQALASLVRSSQQGPGSLSPPRHAHAPTRVVDQVWRAYVRHGQRRPRPAGFVPS